MQKTAYEMRISDWSSNVCSSDLIVRKPISSRTPVDSSSICAFARARASRERYVQPSDGSTDGLARDRALITDTIGSIPAERDEPDRHHPPVSRAERNFAIRSATRRWRRIRRSRTSSRSEEHTSELQSLMRISYADFC